MLSVDEAIVEKLRSDGPCCFDELVIDLPDYSWGQIFLAVDCMSRDGLLSLCPVGSATYQISLGSLLPYELIVESNS
jgi:hypothetical protein